MLCLLSRVLHFLYCLLNPTCQVLALGARIISRSAVSSVFFTLSSAFEQEIQNSAPRIHNIKKFCECP